MQRYCNSTRRINNVLGRSSSSSSTSNVFLRRSREVAASSRGVAFAHRQTSFFPVLQQSRLGSSASSLHSSLSEEHHHRQYPRQRYDCYSSKPEHGSELRRDDSIGVAPPPPPPLRSYWLRTSTSMMEYNWLPSSWWTKVPKGFENFYRKDKEGKPIAPEVKKDKPKSTSNKFQSKNNNNNNRDKKKKGWVPPGEDPSSDPQNIPALIALLLMVLAGRQLFWNDKKNGDMINGSEITFVQFRNQLLYSNQVEQVVVVNDEMARVILRPGSKGIPTWNATSTTSNSSSGSTNSSDDGTTTNTVMAGGREALVGDQEDQEGTILEFSQSSDEVTNEATTDSSSSLFKGRSKHNKDHSPPVYHFYIGSVESFEEKLSKAQNHLHPRDWIPVQYAREVDLLIEFIKLTPMLTIAGLFMYFSRGLMGGSGMGGAGGGAGGGMGGIFQVGKSNAKKVKPELVDVNFGDVAGCQQAKLEIMEFVDFLKDSTRFTKLGAKIPKGALLCGPPGTGKTLLAKAVAGEAGVPFFSISGSDFIEMFVGVGPSRVRDLFKEARASAPCIIFIDEIDAVGRQRGRGGFSGGNDERENTLNQLLVEMDGFTESTGVVVLAGTNRADILDQALTRPGRFDRQVTVDKPDLEGRKDIFNVHLKGITLEGEMEDYAGRLAGLTPGMAGADIANLCNEAAIVAARRAAETVTITDFEKATDRIVGGLESNKIMSDQERSIVAYHEAGHAVAGWFLEHADPLLKVTIIPRASGALGFAQYLPKEVFLRTEGQIMDIVCMALAGRAAEEVFFGNVTTGASDDLRRVTQLVYSTIQTYGMNDRVGQLAYPRDSDGSPGDKPYSDSTAEAMDDEARAIVDAAYERTVALMKERKHEVDLVAKLLLDKETITHDDMIDTVGERPFQGNDQYEEYISARHAQKKADESKEKEVENTTPEDKEDLNQGGGGLTPGLA